MVYKAKPNRILWLFLFGPIFVPFACLSAQSLRAASSSGACLLGHRVVDMDYHNFAPTDVAYPSAPLAFDVSSLFQFPDDNFWCQCVMRKEQQCAGGQNKACSYIDSNLNPHSNIKNEIQQSVNVYDEFKGRQAEGCDFVDPVQAPAHSASKFMLKFQANHFTVRWFTVHGCLAASIYIASARKSDIGVFLICLFLLVTKAWHLALHMRSCVPHLCFIDVLYLAPSAAKFICFFCGPLVATLAFMSQIVHCLTEHMCFLIWDKVRLCAFVVVLLAHTKHFVAAICATCLVLMALAGVIDDYMGCVRAQTRAVKIATTLLSSGVSARSIDTDSQSTTMPPRDGLTRREF